MGVQYFERTHLAAKHMARAPCTDLVRLRIRIIIAAIPHLHTAPSRRPRLLLAVASKVRR